MQSLFFSGFILSFALTALLVIILPKIKFQQVVREEGPESHKKKSGTPTMGGLGFVVASSVLAFYYLDQRLFPVVFLYLGYGLIGMMDDLIKIFNTRNLGLTFWQKIIIQTIISGIFAFYAAGGIGSFTSLLYVLFLMFIVVGAANAANLTDGLDGLLSGTAIIAFGAFMLIASKLADFQSEAFCALFIAALFGFIVFNFPKSKIFMGDTGSLAIGSALAGIAIVMKQELLLIIIGGVLIAEAMSVILQVGYYKMFKARIFKMAPLHHHFELSGMKENTVVLSFWLVQLVLSTIGVLIVR